jgi:hypothetical protein
MTLIRGPRSLVLLLKARKYRLISARTLRRLSPFA